MKPVVFLAAEIAKSCQDVLPGRAAILADKLCRLGRSYYAASEQSANGGPEDLIEALYQKLSRIEHQAKELVAGLPIAIETSALHMSAATVHKRRGGRFTERTTLL